MSAREIDQYLDEVEEPKRSTLAQLRQTILAALPAPLVEKLIAVRLQQAFPG